MFEHKKQRRFVEFAVQGLVLLALLACVFPGTFLRGEMISPADMLFLIPPWRAYAPEGFEHARNKLMSDVVTAFHPYYVLTRAALDAGEWPLWNPCELTGLPLMANCQTAVFYPPRLLHCFMDLDVATTIYIVLKLWLCGMIAYVCGRALPLGVPAARFLSVAWMLSSYNVIWCNWSIPDVSAWVPLLFVGMEFVLAGRYRRGFFTVLLGATLLMLAGHPETAFVMGVGMGWYFLLRLIWERRRGKALWVPIGVCAAAWMATLCVCAVQLLPFIEYLRHSYTFSERASVDEASILRYYLPPAGLGCLWVPRLFGTFADRNYWVHDRFNSNFYCQSYAGIAVWFGIMLLMVKGPRDGRRRAQTACLLMTTGICVMMAVNVFPFSWITSLPVFDSTIGVYFINFALFTLPLLGAIGIERWFAQPRRLRELGWCLPLIPVAVGTVYFVYVFNEGLIRMEKVAGFLREQFVAVAVFAFLALACIGAYPFFKKPRILVALLTLILACDLGMATRGLNPTMPRDLVFPRTQLTDYLGQQEPPCRVGAGEGGIVSGVLAAYGIEEWLGYDGLYPARILRFQKTLEQSVWNAMEPACGIDLYLNDPRYEPIFPLREKAGRFEYVATIDGLEVYRNKRALPRAFLAGGLELVPDIEEMLGRMGKSDFDPTRLALTEGLPSGVSPMPETAPAGRATVTSRASTRVTVEVDAGQESVLVLSDAYYPGWTATIDGRAAEIFPAYSIFRGLVVPAGKSSVEYEYRPRSFYVGLWISCLALALSAAYASFRLRRSRRCP